MPMISDEEYKEYQALKLVNKVLALTVQDEKKLLEAYQRFEDNLNMVKITIESSEKEIQEISSVGLEWFMEYQTKLEALELDHEVLDKLFGNEAANTEQSKEDE